MQPSLSFIAALAAILSGAATAGAPPVAFAHVPVPSPRPAAALSQHADWPAPEPAEAGVDVPASLDGVIAALYAGVSGDADHRRDWRAFGRLFLPGARITHTRADAAGRLQPRTMDVAEFGALNDRSFAGRGFHESEIHRETSHYGGVVHVWSVYEARETPGAAAFARGANSLQLLHTPQGWRILSLTWERETPSTPLSLRFAAVASSTTATASVADAENSP